ncbi:DUF1573 domain-containing protein [uncultured Bacteroides sp.]|uniref:DUF1573 domain-containing protein n=1 Tax=uncultured Bacteroides sp. TaxID=162156 RepID=UPI002AAA6A87|nr:DUF1573 domain-containing protein [uncultured Bacteroides sp.]
MKRFLLLTCSLFFLSLAAWSQARISTNGDVYDFGIIPRNKPVTKDFTIINTGNKPLVIYEVTASCACTATDWTNKPIAPGDTGFVRSTFDAKAMGRFYKTINIHSNAANSVKYIAIKGEVAVGASNYKKELLYEIGPMRLDKRYIEFPPANSGDKPTAEIQVANTSDKSIDITLMHLPPYIKAEAKPEILYRGRKGKITLTLDTKQLKELGLTQVPIYLARYSGDKVSVDNEIDVSAILLPGFSGMTALQKDHAPKIKISSTNLEMGEVSSKGEVSQTIFITNTGITRLEIKKLQVFNSAVGVSLGKKLIQPGQTTKLKVEISGKWLKKTKGETKVMMITNDPVNPLMMINLKVKIKEETKK